MTTVFPRNLAAPRIVAAFESRRVVLTLDALNVALEFSPHMVKGRHYYSAHTYVILTLILNNAQCARSPIVLLVHVLYYRSVTSTLVAALEIWPPSKCRRAKLDHVIKCRRGEISRKYGMPHIKRYMPVALIYIYTLIIVQ